MECPESMLVQSYFDGEIDAVGVAEVERHLSSCVPCQALLADLKQVRTLVRGQGAQLTVPAALRNRIHQLLDQEAAEAAPSRPRIEPPHRARPFWIGLLSGVGGCAAAAAFAFLIVAPLLSNRLVSEMVADHTGALTAHHLIDVVSTDQHTVKPWFAGRTDVSPEVTDFKDQGYRLLGGRVAAVDHQRAPVVVYQHGAHIITVFSWAIGTAGAPGDTTRNGYHVACWQSADLGYCAVADTGWSELQALQGLIQNQSAHDVPQ